MAKIKAKPIIIALLILLFGSGAGTVAYYLFGNGRYNPYTVSLVSKQPVTYQQYNQSSGDFGGVRDGSEEYVTVDLSTATSTLPHVVDISNPSSSTPSESTPTPDTNKPADNQGVTPVKHSQDTSENKPTQPAPVSDNNKPDTTKQTSEQKPDTTKTPEVQKPDTSKQDLSKPDISKQPSESKPDTTKTTESKPDTTKQPTESKPATDKGGQTQKQTQTVSDQTDGKTRGDLGKHETGQKDKDKPKKQPGGWCAWFGWGTKGWGWGCSEED